jgi:polyisoprenoid-binding protein YceI
MCKQLIGWALLSLGVTLVGCGKNPGDGVTPAEVSVPAAEITLEDPAAVPDATLMDIQVADSKIDFIGSKVTGVQPGGFKVFAGTLAVLDDELLAAGSQITIDMTSTYSNTEKLTAHLNSADFFDVEQFPEATFVFTAVEDQRITGNLTFHGVTKSIAIPVEYEVIDDVLRLVAEFKIKRHDFGIKYPGKPDDLIRDDVVINLNIVAK